MRCAIFADIHSNLAAFEAVLRDVEAGGGFDEIWCLGDVVGYGPDPHECLGLLRQYQHVCVAGNHDWGAVGRIDITDFNPVAARACRWTGQQLTDEDAACLRDLPASLRLGDFTLVHGSPREPVREYVLSVEAAEGSFESYESAYCLIGHSHIPMIFEQVGDKAVYREFKDGNGVALGENRLIINPGSIGQPRDGDPRASYAVYDTEAQAVYLYRVEYDIAVTQRKMEERGLPAPLIRRLGEGW